LEAEGFATVGLTLVRGQTERLQPPRALYCEFPLGRPLGRPGDPAFQRRVLDAAFALLDRPAGPVLEDFPEVIDDEVDSPLACAVPPRMNRSDNPAVDEALALRAAYDRQLRASGRTMVGRQITADQVPAAVEAFTRIAGGAPLAEAGVEGDPVKTANGVRVYYEEAAMALEGHVPAARSAESWYFRKTLAGDAVRRAQRVLREGGGPNRLVAYLVPRSQLLP